MACNKQKITKHDRFGIFRSGLEMVMSGILKDDNYLYYKYGLFMGMEDKRLSRHYPCHTDMITCSLSFPRGKKISWSPKLLYSIMAKAKTLLLRKKIHTLFLKMDEDKSSFLYLPSNVASQRYVSNVMA